MEAESNLRQLLDRVLSGDEAASSRLVEKYNDHVLRVVRNKLPRELRAKYDSDDFRQDVWKSVFAHPEQLAKLKDEVDLIGLLTAMTRNQMADAFRRKVQAQKADVRRERRLDDSTESCGPTVADRGPSPSQFAIADEQWERLTRDLSPKQREVLEMARDGVNQEEIGKKLGVSARTVRRLLRKLESDLE